MQEIGFYALFGDHFTLKIQRDVKVDIELSL